MKVSLEGLIVLIIVGLCVLVAMAALFREIWPVALVVFAGYLWYKRDKDKRSHKCLDCEMRELHKHDI